MLRSIRDLPPTARKAICPNRFPEARTPLHSIIPAEAPAIYTIACRLQRHEIGRRRLDRRLAGLSQPTAARVQLTLRAASREKRCQHRLKRWRPRKADGTALLPSREVAGKVQ